MLEYEKKVLLTKEEYSALIGLKDEVLNEEQTNYYFDTNSFDMNRKGITCRIRQKDGIYKATVKHHDTVYSGRSTEEDIYEGSEYNASFFEALGLHIQGELITIRALLFTDPYCEIVLDKNAYLGDMDFEIEVEYAEEYEEKALDYLKDIAAYMASLQLIDSTDAFLHRVGKGKSKSERFFERKQQVGGDGSVVYFRRNHKTEIK